MHEDTWMLPAGGLDYGEALLDRRSMGSAASFAGTCGVPAANRTL